LDDDEAALSVILTIGGTILGTSRDKPNRLPVGGQLLDMTDAMDRLLATHLGSVAADLIAQSANGIMIAVKNQETEPVPLVEVVDKRRMAPLDQIWVKIARRVGTSFGV
jgi:6-phosphofructokinase